MSGPHVLLVEDDQWLGDHFARMLERAGYHVSRATNGVAAMDAVDTMRPDVIVLDIFMPGPNGFVLLHELQSHSDLAHIPIILCSNAAADISEDLMKPYGIVAKLDKATMEPDDLSAAIRKVLQ